MFIVMLESESEQTWEREDFQLHGENFRFDPTSSCVCVCVCLCPTVLAPRLSQATSCTALLFTNTEALSFGAQCRLTEGGGWEGGSQGTKLVGGETNLRGQNE